ncbi:aspartyl-phosphate phosphatase Spo0E family protein [Cohnella lubricantis]|uniref:Spo0E family sporulation regulatory protein-aspartic acid phosphatase n=1 Tax=Cohnella lubricantis TaxID=2163172 RepID=A0A841TCV4_9BACL|nr:aspartyl-phosphate phosphatase Spo0E family protein [Cohnella lubricantis]MBB6676807.1 Spo0E family sporulation regulatory protein-aspartic acid phosphatase [Cohnella lubricantis]MBP2118105.1 stress response protein YsnF [Cohnella lubricantis]
MDTNLLIYRLKLLQKQLCEMAKDLGNLTDPEIVAVSEEADRLIVQLQKIRMNEYVGKKLCSGKSASALFADPQSAEEIGQERSALLLKHS